MLMEGCTVRWAIRSTSSGLYSYGARICAIVAGIVGMMVVDSKLTMEKRKAIKDLNGWSPASVATDRSLDLSPLLIVLPDDSQLGVLV